jgi:NADPH:quinone reductase-like Zn-dependent oxidoreductase
MKAIVLTHKGGQLVLRDMPDPVPQKGEACIRIQAAGFNRRDYFIQQGLYARIVLPAILGSDGTGIVEAVGSDTDNSWTGKAVVINPSFNWGNDPAVQQHDFRILGMPDHGTFAEKVCVPVDYLYERPQHLDPVSAAPLPLGGLTAYRALFTRGNLKAGEKVLITGTGGGVALFVLQFALAAGATVYVTSGSDEKILKAVAMGAAGGANYRASDWPEELAEKAGAFDLIVDSAGGDGFDPLTNLANPGGRIVIYGGTRGAIPKISPQKIFWKQLSILGTTMGTQDDFQQMHRFVTQHQIRPVVDSVFQRHQANEALARLESSMQFGKVVMEMIE